MFDQPDPAPVHDMQMTCTRPGHFWLVCPVCGKSVMLIADPFFCQCVKAGDEYAQHRGGIGGVTMNVEIGQLDN